MLCYDTIISCISVSEKLETKRVVTAFVVIETAAERKFVEWCRSVAGGL